MACLNHALTYKGYPVEYFFNSNLNRNLLIIRIKPCVRPMVRLVVSEKNSNVAPTGGADQTL